jgi:glycerol-3-phosphate dehydrogenase
MKSENQLDGLSCDVVVVGGGITGAGIARDAAMRGLHVVLLEKCDFAAGTSSKSSKLIHGGLRYLEQAELGLVFESLRERSILSQLAPHLVRPLPFLLPVYKGAPTGLETVNVGLWIYDTLAMFRSPRRHRTYRGASAAMLEPALLRSGMRGAVEYFDCATDDARLVLETILDAQTLGAECRSYTELTRLDRDATGRVHGVAYRDVLSGAEGVVACRAVIVAAGPWTDEVNQRLGIGIDRRLLRPTKGVHLVFPRERLPVSRALTLLAPEDDRVVFAIPWAGRTVVGTTDTDFDGVADQVAADRHDVEYLCGIANHFFPAAQLGPNDVLATWAGLRPLIADAADQPSTVSREHTILVRGDGVTVIAGGKITTYRHMACQCVDATLRWLRRAAPETLAGRTLRRGKTDRRPLPGGQAISPRSEIGAEQFARDLARKHRLEPALADHLVGRYGSRANTVCGMMARAPQLAEPLQDDLPDVWAEVDFAVEHDLAKTVDDVLSRRLSILLLGRQQGLDLAEPVAARMAAKLGWTEQFQHEQISAYRQVVAASRAFRNGPAEQEE